MSLYHICQQEEWEARSEDYYKPFNFNGEGCIHFSSGFQLPQTYELHFADQDSLLCLEVNFPDNDSNLNYVDVPERGEKFPHYCAPLKLKYIKKVIELPQNNADAMKIMQELE